MGGCGFRLLEFGGRDELVWMYYPGGFAVGFVQLVLGGILGGRIDEFCSIGLELEVLGMSETRIY